jgi:hypothetical protein
LELGVSHSNNCGDDRRWNFLGLDFHKISSKVLSTKQVKERRVRLIMIKSILVVATLLFATLISMPVYAKKGSGLSSPSSGGSHSVRGHARKDGTYVQPHRATNQNKTQRDNWSSKPNVNPYTGKPGEKESKY